MTANRSRPERGVEILRAFTPWLGPADRAINHLDGAGDEDLASGARFEESIANAEGNLRLVHLDHTVQEIAVGIDHRASKFLRQ